VWRALPALKWILTFTSAALGAWLALYVFSIGDTGRQWAHDQLPWFALFIGLLVALGLWAWRDERARQRQHEQLRATEARAAEAKQRAQVQAALEAQRYAQLLLLYRNSHDSISPAMNSGVESLRPESGSLHAVMS